MDWIIKSLKARQAGISAMLDPGKSPRSGNGLLFNSSSLQPQKTFRKTASSLSVKKPAVMMLKESSLSAFTRKTEQKYSEASKLLHFSSAYVPPETVRQTSAQMPLPVSGIASASTEVTTPISSSVPSVESSPAYPSKSERRQITFERSDGPSDFEKRLKAARAQKAAQEAKKQPPARQRVRTEKFELSADSSGDASNAVQREMDPGISQPVMEAVQPKRQALKGKYAGTEPLHRDSEIKTPEIRSPEKSEPAEAVTELPGPGIPQMDLSNPNSENTDREKPIQREIRTSKSIKPFGKPHAVKTAEPVPMIKRITAEPHIPETDNSGIFAAPGKNTESVQREILPAVRAEQTGEKTALKTSEPAEPVEQDAIVPSQPVQFDAQPVAKASNRTAEELSAGTKAASVQMTRRESFSPAEDTTDSMHQTEMKEQEEIIQREMKSAKPVRTSADAVKTAEPIREIHLDASDRMHQTEMKAQGKIIQREIKSAQPVRTSAEAGKTAEPIRKRHQDSSDSMRSPEASKTAAEIPVAEPTNQPFGGEHIINREMQSASAEREKKDDLRELLKTLPSHYEMPKEQVEAIRSGKYDVMTANQPPEEQVVRREISPAISAAPEKVSGHPSFILPIKQSGYSQKNGNSTAGSVEEIDRNLLPGMTGTFQKSNTKLTAAPHKGFDIGKNSRHSGMNPGPSNFLSKRDDGLVQREFDIDGLKSGVSDKISEMKNKVSDVKDKLMGNDDQSDGAEEKEKSLETILPAVTAVQLDMLADRLLPRIKRIMRNEMERSSFR